MSGLRAKLRSVRVVMTLWNVGVLALVLIGFAVALRITMQTHIARDIDQGMARGVHGLQRFFDNSPNPNATPPRFVVRRMRDRDTPPVPYPPAFLDLNGQPIWPQAPNVATKPWDAFSFAQSLKGKERFSTVTIKGAHIRIFSAPLKRNGQIVGVVQFTTDLSIIPRTLRWVNWTLLVLIPIALLIAGILGGFLTSRMLRPVRALADAAEQIEGHNLSDRLPVAGGDEFSELATTFNNTLDRLESAFRRLEESSEQQRRFTGDASHELRTPLTIIKANASLALSGERTPAQYRQAIGAINLAADRMNRLVQDLLFIARSDSGQMEVSPKPVLAKEVLDEAAYAVEHAEGRSVAVDVADEDIAVLGDFDMLVRLFTNLLSNAIKHTPESGAITASARRSADQVIISVADTGEGIAPEHLAHLTERFYRVDAARTSAAGGTGLGLAIVQTIVEAHHGEMAIDSILGKGTCVSIRLLAAPAPEPTQPPLPAPALPAARA